jgi:nicotinate-nucleotide adenylyltransferase
MALIGLFGGTFNPVHYGHIRAAEEVLAHLPLDRILFIPSYIPPHKDSREVVAVEHRLKMVEIACQNHPKILVSEREARNPGRSYSILTLKKLKEINKEDQFFFILGSDAFMEIETWKDYTELLKQCAFVVISRPGYAFEMLGKVIERIKNNNSLKVFGPELPEKVELKEESIYLLKIRTPSISSSEIRKRLQAGLSISGLVPPGVEDYIHKFNLYK